MTDIFVSYARSDATKAERLVRALEQQGLSVWWDPTLVPGDVWDEAIQTALRAAKVVIVAWTRDSVTRRWVKTEASDALQRGVLVPVFLELAKVPLQFGHIQTADLSAWDGTARDPQFELLLHSIAKRMKSATDLPAVAPSEVPVQVSQASPVRQLRSSRSTFIAVTGVLAVALAAVAWLGDRSKVPPLPPPLQGGQTGTGPSDDGASGAPLPTKGHACTSSTPRCATGLFCAPDGRCREEGEDCDTSLPGACKKGQYERTGESLRCVPKLTSSPEVCDCRDNDCDGRIDDNLSCSCTIPGAKGRCALGTRECDGGMERCQPTRPSTELCKNAIDDDCDGLVDEGCITVTKARIGCLDIQTSGNLTSVVGQACNGLQTCAFKAPSEAAYRDMGVQAATRSFCTQGMEITYLCGTTDIRVATVPGDAWNHGAAQLTCR